MTQIIVRQQPSPPGTPDASPSPSDIDLSDYCARRLAGLETGPIPNIGPSSAAAIWSMVAFAIVFLLLRIHCKIWRSRGIWWDDVVLILSWTMFLAAATMCQRVINHGMGKYPCDIHPQSNLSRINFEGGGLGTAFILLAVMWSKTSFGITIFRLARDKVRVLVLCVLVLMNVAMGLQVVFVWVKCDPVEKNWRPQVAGTCWPLRVSNGYGVFGGVLSGVCDVLFALLPWHLLWKLRMRKKEKIGVVVAMSMGVFAGTTSFVKAAHVVRIGSKNFTYDGCYLLTWASAEIATTIMASCIPVLRVLLRELRDATPVELSVGHFSPRNRDYHKSNSTGGTAKGPVTGSAPADSTLLPHGYGYNNTELSSPQKGEGPPEPFTSRSYWDFGRGSSAGAAKPLDSKAATPYVLAENSSQRVLVQPSEETGVSEVATDERNAGPEIKY